jgi:3-oxoacyl-[acyl-carrier protein] reductase
MMGKCAVVTGGSGGIGEAISLKLAEAGFDICINYHNTPERAERVKKEVERIGRRAITFKADVSRSPEVKEMVKGATDAFGGIEVLVNNAGILSQQTVTEDLSEKEWDRMLAVNLKGPFLCSRFAIPYLKKAHRASIVNISSIAGKMGGVVGVHYAASKAGLIGFTMALASELAPYNITCNAVAPGPVDTALIDASLKEKLKGLTPLNRIAKPEEIAFSVLFLIENRYITGETIDVNGGRYMD